MVRFGGPWPSSNDLDQVDVPVGEKCTYCLAAIGPSDSGVLLPFVGGPGSPTRVPYHRYCLAASMGVRPRGPRPIITR